MTAIPDTQVPGVYRRKVGDIVITAIADGFLDGDLEVLRNIDTGLARDILTANFRPARRTAINTFLIHTGGKTVLMETGCGNFMQASAGKQLANLAAAGVQPADIDAVLLTHMHPDHSAGLTEKETRNSSAMRTSPGTGTTTPRWRAATSGRRRSSSSSRAIRWRPTRTG
jgi:glyoxylase-like metal-dependent hydrolase (beta-lactamase superfamily II)